MPKPASNSVGRTLLTFAFFGAVSAALAWVLMVELGISQCVPAFRGRAWIPVAIVAAGALIGITRLARFMHAITGLLVATWLVICLTPISARMVRPLKTESAPVPA